VSSPIPTGADCIVTSRCPCLVVSSFGDILGLVVALDRAIEFSLTFPSHPSSERVFEDTASAGSASETIDLTEQRTVNRY
jgi:hypothetical protein